jgi:hypothetical protein
MRAFAFSMSCWISVYLGLGLCPCRGRGGRCLLRSSVFWTCCFFVRRCPRGRSHPHPGHIFARCGMEEGPLWAFQTDGLRGLYLLRSIHDEFRNCALIEAWVSFQLESERTGAV